MAAVAQLLSDEGYMAEGTTSAQKGTLIEHNCAVQAVARAISGNLCGGGQVSWPPPSVRRWIARGIS